MDTVKRMGQNYQKMTDVEKKIYHHIMKNPLAISLKPISEVASELNISKTSLMRFAKGLGYQGYAQFKKNLQEEEILNSSPAERIKKLFDSDYINSAIKTKNKEVENIENTLIQIDDVKFNELIELINSNKKIYTIGWKMGHYLADILTYRLRHLGYDSLTISRDVIDFDEQMMHLKENDILIVFDFYKYSRAINRATKIAKQKNVNIVVITDNLSCPLCGLTDLTFFCCTKTDLLMNSMIGSMFLINLIISEIIYRMEDDKMINILDNRYKITKESEEYF